MKIRILTKAEVMHTISMREAIEQMRAAFAELATGTAVVPPRIAVKQERTGGVTLCMPGYLGSAGALAVKVASVHPGNAARDLPVVNALVLVIDVETGCPVAVMEGSYLTALRTGAATGLATELLSRKGAKVAAIFGAGAQARTQLAAIAAVRRIERVYVYAPRPERVKSFIDEMGMRLGGELRLIAADSAKQAVSEADIICAATSSATPVFDGADLKEGAHVNGVGSFKPEMRELDAVTLKRAAKIVVDTRDGAMSEAGEIIQAIARGEIREENIYAGIGEIAAGMKPGREAEDEITVFKSVGNAAQDAAVAQAILERAREKGIGREMELG